MPARRITSRCLVVALAASCIQCGTGQSARDASNDVLDDARAFDAATHDDVSDVPLANDTFEIATDSNAIDAADGAITDVTDVRADAGAPFVLAVIGDYGVCGAYTSTGGSTGYEVTCSNEQDVARLVHGWHPDAVLTTGDNSYGSGQLYQIPGDQAPYDDIIAARTFWPAMGNHDWFSPISNSLTYFHLSAPHYVQRFGTLLSAYVLDTNPGDVDGDLATGAQARAFTTDVAASTARWNIAVNHQAPYSSCGEGSYDGHDAMHPDYRWVAAPGVDLVLSGHSHVYERLVEPNVLGAESVPHVVIGCSGAPLQGNCSVTLPGQRAVYYHVFGALRITVTMTDLLVEFVDTTGLVRDRLALHKAP